MIAALRKLHADSRGIAMVEFGFALPILITLTFGTVELSRYVLLHQKLDRIAMTIADLAAQSEELAETDVGNILAAVSHIGQPFDVDSTGLVILTSVSRSGNQITVDWQRRNAGAVIEASRIGQPGQPAALPDGLVLLDGDNVIVSEVFFDYTPMLTGTLLGNQQLYHSAFFRPRFGSLDQIN
jgi:Flp pilus assembly protein TadG